VNPRIQPSRFVWAKAVSPKRRSRGGGPDPGPGSRIPDLNAKWYLLGFEATHADGRFRKLEVRVNRPGLIVRTRGGCFAPKPDKKAAASKPRPESTDLFKAMAAVLPTSDMPMRVDVAPFATGTGSGSAMAIVVGLRETVPADTPRIVENIELLATAFTQKYHSSLVPVIPTTQRVFYRAVYTPTAFVRLYQPLKASGGVRLASTIVNNQDVRVFERKDTPELTAVGKTRTADYQLAMPISTLSPGSYLLTFEASDGRHSAKRQVRFEIR
jgi:hypothetical protein